MSGPKSAETPAFTPEDDLEALARRRYPSGDVAADEPEREFRDYRADARPRVREFYRLNHERQTLDFVRAKKAEYLGLDHRQMGIWEAMEFLDTLVDDSDPDTDLSQIEHLMQTAEAIRRDGQPRWFILTGLIHDLGKILCLWGEPQWAVVGDTFPVGCAYSESVVFPEYFELNADAGVPEYQTSCGIYDEGCGLDGVHLSWGHDEYLYRVVKPYLSPEALAMIRFHSFYAFHQDGAYMHLTDDHDRLMLPWIRRFQPYDLYSKSRTRPDVASLTPFYRELIAEYFPATIRW